MPNGKADNCSALRYLRVIVHGVTYAFFIKPIPVPNRPTVSAKDVTVVLPTTASDIDALAACMQSILANNPSKLVLVTSTEKLQTVKDMCPVRGIDTEKVQVLGVMKLNKRSQIMKGLDTVFTDITVFADDDVVWPKTFLQYLLAAFEDPAVGAAGTKQRIRRVEKPNLWHFLGVSYIERRNYHTGSLNAIDGSVFSALSGRTSSYRTHILRDKKMRNDFLFDTWGGDPLHADDDSWLTRYAYSKGWKIRLQFAEEAMIHTPLEETSKYLDQCLRWARGHRLTSFRAMKQSFWYRSHPWSVYAVYTLLWIIPSVVVEVVLACLLYHEVGQDVDKTLVMAMFGIWLLFTKLVKLIPHFSCYPQDLIYVPAAILFGWIHGFINIYALLTLSTTVWGSRDLGEGEKKE
ncbi:hypothetical protein EJ06DRAFT_564566 [Trichodelitschia bisporula]|uniref:Glycosyltransferase family 2 protein n=1 Tax=Trichodelitschia bisporula TaxID=703511 RepID=A0A6G1HQW7_9PEZI|nr:hypothetical protein EJ06DRAFT_564566 [Trichodelitschia bisporula]